MFQISESGSELYPDLRFTGFALGVAQLCDKGRMVTTLSPGFGYIGAYGARRSADLVGKRIFLLMRKSFGQIKDFQSRVHSILVDAKLLMAASKWVHQVVRALSGQIIHFDSRLSNVTPKPRYPHTPIRRPPGLPRQGPIFHGTIGRAFLDVGPMGSPTQLRYANGAGVPSLGRGNLGEVCLKREHSKSEK